MSNDQQWVNNVADLMKSKNGSLYIKFNRNADLQEGDILILKKKSDEIDDSVKRGSITEEKGEELKEKLSFIKYVAHRPPSMDK